MSLTHKNEAPVLLGGPAGASEHKEGYDEHAPHSSSIPRTVLDRNPQLSDLIVQAIRILARRGRQLREAEQAGSAAHSNAEAQTAGATEHANPTASVSDIRTGPCKAEVSHG